MLLQIDYNTLCLKKVPIFKLSATFSNLNGFSNFLHYWKEYEICYINARYNPHHRTVLCSKFRTLSRSAKILPTNRGPLTKPFQLYFSLMIDAYETTT